MILSKNDRKNITQFKNEILALVAERREANAYSTTIDRDATFSLKGVAILNKYLDKIENKTMFKDIIFEWARTMEENPDKLEPYIIHGMKSISGALILYVSTGIKIEVNKGN